MSPRITLHKPRAVLTSAAIQVGKDVTTFSKGDLVVSPFTVSCGQCFYCKQGFSSRCEKSLLFGSAGLDGGQAEYVRVPLAEATAMKAPEGIKESALVLMADIFPTGYFAASNAFKQLSEEQIKESTVVLLGLGPVGLCALLNLLDYGVKKLIVVDGVDSRLQLAEKLGEGKVEAWNFMKDEDGLKKRVKEVTEGRGADVVVEVVGLSAALKLGFDLLRPWGVISSVGVHNAEVSLPTSTSMRGITTDKELDPVDRQPGIWKELEDPDGEVPCQVHLSRSTAETQGEAAQIGFHVG